MEYKIKITRPGYVLVGIGSIVLSIWFLMDLIYLEYDIVDFGMMTISLGYGVFCVVGGAEFKKIKNKVEDN